MYLKIKAEFLTHIDQEKRQAQDFEDAIQEISEMLNQCGDAVNFQYAFDALYFAWECQLNIQHHEAIPITELDRIALKYSQFGEHQEAVIQNLLESADEWHSELTADGLNSTDALALSMLEARFIVEAKQRKTATIDHPSPIAVPQKIVQLYRNFYRAEKRYNPETTNALKPLLLVKDVISRSRSVGEDLHQEVLGRVCAFMRQVRRGTAKGRWVIKDSEIEREEIVEFTEFMVYHVLGQRFNGDKSQFSGRNGIGLIEDACSAIYLLEQDKENRA